LPRLYRTPRDIHLFRVGTASLARQTRWRLGSRNSEYGVFFNVFDGHGYPPNSPGLHVVWRISFWAFKGLFANVCPKRIPEAITVVTKIVKEMGERPQK
jgi:hypothetical protein